MPFLQFVAVDRGVAEDADARYQFLRWVAHRFVLAGSRRTRNPQTPQGRGVDEVVVVLDDLHAQRFTRVYNVSTLIHHKREEDVIRLHELPHETQKVLLDELRIERLGTNTVNVIKSEIKKHAHI